MLSARESGGRGSCSMIEMVFGWEVMPGRNVNLKWDGDLSISVFILDSYLVSLYLVARRG
jgi:hypothetical protein